MRLHDNKTLFRQAIQFTSDQLNIPAIYVEKDYWVTFALYIIYHSNLKDETVFKGGTSLSKCFRLIDRFSEDIDLVLLRRDGESNSRMSTKLKAVSTLISKSLPEIEIAGITNKMGMNRKTAHTYGKHFEGDFGQIRDSLIIESSWLSHHEPYTTRSITSMIGEIMLGQDQESLVKENLLLPFDVLVLEPTRTLCEKIMSLVRFSYGQDPVEALKIKIRHIYDIERLLNKTEFSSFFDSTEFDEMLIRVAGDDVSGFRNNNQWLNFHPKKSLIFSQPEDIWNQIKSSYLGNFANLIYGKLPDESEMLSTLIKIQKRLDKIIWSITTK